MPSPFHPEGLYCSWTSLVHCQAVGEIDHLIFGTMDYQHRRGYLRYLVNAGGWKRKNSAQFVTLIFTQLKKVSLTTGTHPAYHCVFLNSYKTLKLCPNDMEQRLLPKRMCKLEPVLPLRRQFWWQEARMGSSANKVWHLKHQRVVYLSKKSLQKAGERQIRFHETCYQCGLCITHYHLPIQQISNQLTTFQS